MSSFENVSNAAVHAGAGGSRIRPGSLVRRAAMLVILLAVQFVASLSVQAQGTYYVRAGASGAKSGTDWVNAYPALPASLVRGATYYMAGGSYGSRAFGDPVSGSSLITIKKATVSAHGTNSGWQDSYGTTQATFGNLSFKTSYYVFDGVTGGGPGNWETGFGFKVQGTYHTIDFPAKVSNITIRHTDIQGGGRSASSDTDLLYLVYPYSNITVSYCFLHDVSRTMILTWPAKGNGFVVEYSKFARNGTAEHREAWSAGPDSNIVVRNNLFEDIFGTGFIAIVNNNGDATNWAIYGNVFYHTGKYTDGMINTGAIITRWDGSSGPISVRPVNWQIHNNAFINIIGYTSAIVLPNASQSAVYNNIWYANKGSTGVSTRTGVSADYNWFYANKSNGNYAAHDVVGSGNPFVNWQNGDFRLANGISGVTLAAQYNQDPLGITRGADGQWDRGAYEYGSSASSLSPPKNLHVVQQ